LEIQQTETVKLENESSNAEKVYCALLAVVEFIGQLLKLDGHELTDTHLVLDFLCFLYGNSNLMNFKIKQNATNFSNIDDIRLFYKNCLSSAAFSLLNFVDGNGIN
jgi:hypothetical protein